jgi:hypothetical protein
MKIGLARVHRTVALQACALVPVGAVARRLRPLLRRCRAGGRRQCTFFAACRHVGIGSH